MVVPCRRFGTTYRQNLQGLSSIFFTLEDGTHRLSRNVGKELPLYAAKNHFTRRIMAIPRRRFGTTYRPNFQGLSSIFFTL